MTPSRITRNLLASALATTLAATAGAAAGAAAAGSADPAANAPAIPNLARFANPSGFAATFSTAGVIDRSGPFFQSLGTNGRSCASCHDAAEGWSITPRGLRQRFARSAGLDPVFRLVDGANSPKADVSTLHARRRAYSMLLDKGLVRVGLPMPAGAEFELAAVDDPYRFASAAELSLFRRPLPTTNLGFLSTVMWDGRETFRDAASADCLWGTTTCFAPIAFDLADQSNVATLGHAQASAAIDAAQREAIVAFEMGLFTAQVWDERAGDLAAAGARGGPVALSQQGYHFGINDTLAGDYRTREPFTPNAMTAYDGWRRGWSHEDRGENRERAEARRAVARGQTLFNTKPIRITGVGGLNDDLGAATIDGSCTTCHNAPNAGNHSVPMPLAIGVADASRRTPDMPLYTLRHKASGETVQVTDPGRALITGKWKDIGRFKGPVLRALATRAPYFHNGMAADLGEVVDFYDQRFGIGLTPRERADLVAFLRTL